MYQIDNSTAAATQPASSAPGTAGWFTDGSTGGGVAPTVVPAEWLNAVQAELCNAIKNQGLSLSKNTFNQLATAMNCFMPPVGSMRNGRMYLAAAAASGTFTADQIVVGTTLSAQPFMLSNFSESINLAATGAGGMDTGSAPVSGYVGLYAIYNPTTSTASILAVNAASALPAVYGGAHMPSGYTASALIGVWPTNGSGNLIAGLQRDRTFQWTGATALSSGTLQSSFTLLSIAGVVPANARSVAGQLQFSSSAVSNASLNIAADANGLGILGLSASLQGAAFAQIGNFPELSLATPQAIYYKSANSSGTPSFVIYINQYTF